MDRLELLQEADRRGLLPPDQKALLAEAINRGLVAKPDAFDAAVSAPEKPSKLVRLGRGIADLTEGIGQGARMIADMLPESGRGPGYVTAPEYTKAKDAEIGAYERGRQAAAPQTVSSLVTGKPADPGIDWLRLGGNVAMTVPAAMIPGAAAASIPIRMLSGAAGGATAASAMYTPESGSKAGQIALGTLTGGAAPAIAQGIKAMGGRAIDMIRPAAAVNPAAQQALAGEITIKLQQQGINWNTLTAEVKKSLLADAQKALDSGGTLDDAMLANKAVIEQVGAKPTTASLSRSPKDWQTQQNLRGITGVGDDITKRAQENAAAMTDYLAKLRVQAGGKAATPIEAGESAVSALQGIDKGIKANVDTAYTAARDHLGRAAPMDAGGFSRAANLALDTEMLGASLPAEARSILNDVSSGKIPLNVNTAVQIDSRLSGMQLDAGKRSQAALAIGKVRDALNKAGISDNVGEDAKAAFDAARGKARDRFVLHEQTPALAAAVDDVAPDKFVQKFILGADVRDMRSAIETLRRSPEGSQAIKDVKGHMLDNLLMKATGATTAEDVAGKAFSGANFSKALDAIPNEKLHILFSPTELDSLRTLQKAAKLLTEEVPFSDVNHSKTAAALANLLQKIGSTPLLGQLVSPIIGAGKIGADWVKNAADRKAVAEVLLGSAAKAGAPLGLPAPGNLARVAPAAAAAAVSGPGERSD